LTTIQSVLAAFAIIFIDLAGRAGLDKVLALAGGPETIALWAQLQSVVELVSAVTLAGVLQGLTVMIAQARESHEEPILLRNALKLGLGTSLSVALVVALAAPALSTWLTQGKISANLFLLAALIGCVTVIPATLNAYWLGKHRQQRMLRLALLTSVALLMVAAGAWLKLSLPELMLVQCVAISIIGFATWLYLRKLSRLETKPKGEVDYLSKLVKFVPVGLAIGIMSPVSMLLVRGMLSHTLSWDEVGVLQALWRSTEWVTATAAGVFSLVFLPRFSSAYGSARFKSEMTRASVAVLIPSALLLLLTFFNQHTMLATLYDARFVVSNTTAVWFMLGCWIRIVSWLFLFGLFAAHRTRLIIAGEIFSLPLYALLLWLFADGMTLERSAILYLVSYLVYLIFNAVALQYSARTSLTASPESLQIRQP
jgi:O-antigen/teichoic acid export membrane protein